jgi:hypothetical protein
VIAKVISGGQTGADQAGLRAAKAFGIETGGWAPADWLTENGSAPWLADEFGLRECPEPDFERPPGMPHWKYYGICYVARTRWNAREADATVWFGRGDSKGFAATDRETHAAGRPLLAIVTRAITPERAVTWLEGFQVRTLNVAGNRESKSPGIGARVEAYLAEVFRLLREERQ